MPNALTWAGITVFLGALVFDFWQEWLSPRLLSREWFPGEPDLPPVAGEVDEPSEKEYAKVILAGYLAGVAILFVAVLDMAPISPVCLPYPSVINEYVMAIFGLTTMLMWYSEGQGVVMPYHSEIRYAIGVMTLIIPLYLSSCGTGII